MTGDGAASVTRGAGEPVLSGPSLPSGDATWQTAAGPIPLEGALVMGIINVTPDSFSDGGTLPTVEAAIQRAESMVTHGAGIIDVGGESTRPGAEAVSTDEELARVLPFVEAAVERLPIPISVDTRSAEVAEACLRAGAAVVNDVSGLAHDAHMARVVAEGSAGVVLMHMRGAPATMAAHADYGDVGEEVAAELGEAVRRARGAGVPESCIVVDPGIGFAKTPTQSLALLGDLATIQALGLPVLVGPSRKSFLGAVLGVPAAERLHGTVAACVAAYLQGARIFRVHDVEPVVQALQVAQAIRDAAAGATSRRSP